MKKFRGLLTVLLSMTMIAGCSSTSSKSVKVPEAVTSFEAAESPITMENLDDFLFRDDVIVIDLRNFEDKFNSGYIRGTDIIPFFQFLEPNMLSRGLVDGKPSWDASLVTMNENFSIENMFQKDKKIVFFCAGGTRAAYMKAILDPLGYTTFNAGAFKDYKGAFKTLGDGEYQLPGGNK